MEWLNILASGQSPWAWLILGAILFALDVMAPGFYLVWFGIASAAVGLLMFAVPLPNPWPLVVFSVASLVSLLIGRALWGSHRERESDRPFLNQRGRQLVGQTFVLSEPIVGGRGRAKVGDTIWTVSGPNLPAGELVRVTSAEGIVLKVEPADGGPRFPKAGSFSF
jgi:membrane protein implicated in regulation of membrane protease activity